MDPPSQTPQDPPLALQCLHELQVVHALQLEEPVQRPAIAEFVEINRNRINKYENKILYSEITLQTTLFLNIIIIKYKLSK